MSGIRVVILAAGKGKRMGSVDRPKVLQPLLGRPLLAYLLDAVADSGIDAKPVLVVGHMAEQVKEICGDGCEYALQERLMGTGDAVRSARGLLEGSAEHVMVLNGDHPLVTGRTIRRTMDLHLANGACLTMGTVKVGDFGDWRKPFEDFGRVLRGAAGEVRGIVEVKDATDEQKSVREVNPSFFCFRAAWLWPALESLTTANAQKEYYLTDLVAKAIVDGEKVAAVDVPAEEAVGVNTPEQLALAERLLKEKNS